MAGIGAATLAATERDLPRLSIGIGACAGASAGANTLDLDALAGQTLTFASTDTFGYGPTALPPIASTIVIEGRGVMWMIPADTPRRPFFVIGANAQDTRTPGYNTPGAGALTLRDAHLRGSVATWLPDT